MQIKKLDFTLIKQVFSIFMKRNLESHKGQHGRILIVGGSKDYYGAPILAAWASLYSGADLIYLLVPDKIAETVKTVAGPDFIVRSYEGDYFNKEGAKIAQEMCEICDCAVIGPGIAKKADFEAISNFIANCNIPLVVDAEAFFAFKKNKLKIKSNIVLTPHYQEFSTLVGEKIPDFSPDLVKLVQKKAEEFNAYIILKGHKDLIASPKGHIFLNQTGNPGMTSGGTGDVLAGIVAGFIGQHLDILSACNAATFICGYTGDLLFKNYSYFYSASQLAKSLPLTLKKLL